MSDATEPQHGHLVRWAVITEMGRVVVETETADAAPEKAERKSHLLPPWGLVAVPI